MLVYISVVWFQFVCVIYKYAYEIEILITNCKIDFIFRSLEIGNHMLSSISLLLVGNNSLMEEL